MGTVRVFLRHLLCPRQLPLPSSLPSSLSCLYPLAELFVDDSHCSNQGQPGYRNHGVVF